MLLHEVKSTTTEQTESIGAEFARYLVKNGRLSAFVAMYADLGSGKTAFVRGMASVIAPRAAVSSPTYAIVNEYKGKITSLYHFDMYRITSQDDLYSIGFFDYDEGIIAAEWCENIPDSLPDTYFKVEIEKIPSMDPTVFDSGERILRIMEVTQ